MYDEVWYKSRALASLTRISEGVWDYSDSLLLYIPGGDDEYEASQQTDKEYARLITQPEQRYLADIAPAVAAELPKRFEYIDLGPGTAHKEQYLFDAFAKQGKEFVYRPVDISEYYLKMAKEYASAQNIVTKPIMSPFEELGQLLGPPTLPRFVSLGLTYLNYKPPVILEILKDIAGTKGKIFINAQIRERIDVTAITHAYTVDIANRMLDAKLAILSIDPKSGACELSCDDTVKAWATLKEVPPALLERGVKSGDNLLVFQSLRHSLPELENDIKQVFPKYKLLDIEQEFVGAILG